MSSYPNIDYSTLEIPDNSGSTTNPDAGNSDSTIAQISGLFDSFGTAAGTIIPAVVGPQPLAPGQSYVVGGKVVTTPPAGGGLFNFSSPSSNSTLIFLGLALLVLYLLFFRK